MKTQIQSLLQKEMDRKDFLKYMGSVFLTVIGVSGLLKAALHHESVQGRGYGASTYGGTKRKLIGRF